MVEKISVYILDNFLYRNEEIKGDKREIMLFGIKRIVEDIPKYLVIFILSAFLDILPLVGVVLAVTIMYKGFIGGAHARTNYECLIFTTIYFIAPVYFSKYVAITGRALYFCMSIILLLSIYVILGIAPADTEEVPIINTKKRNRLKLMALISLVILYLILIFIVDNPQIKLLIMFTIFLVDIGTTKPMYRVLRCKYSYESEELKEYFN